MGKSDRKKILILSFTLVVVMLGFGMVIPVFPFYIEELGAGGSELGLLVATSALLEFLFAPETSRKRVVAQPCWALFGPRRPMRLACYPLKGSPPDFPRKL